MKLLCDTHAHSTVSDGGNTPEEMLTAAANQGLKVFTLTDHFDIHERHPEPLSPFDGAGRESSYKQLCRLKAANLESDTIKFLNGIEIAQAHQYKEIAENWLDTHAYDYVLASCHVIRGHIDFYHMDYVANPPDVLLKQYFAELIELCEWGGASKRIDSLAHLTYPLRYMKGEVDIVKNKSAIDDLFRVLIKYEIALELNTGYALLCPELSLIERYRELGGRLITIGSDAHGVDLIAQRFEAAVETAKTAGFTECVYYQDRKANFVKLS